MKTQIITLESHDDLISVRDRMSWAKTPRILLVWPKYEKVTLRQVDLKVLQRHAASLGAQLGLVSRRRRVRLDAGALHIPVFSSTGQAQRQAWPRPRQRHWLRRPPRRDLRELGEQARVPEAAWRAHPLARILAFLVGVLAVLALVALFVPRAEVSLAPETRAQSLVLPVTASPSLGSVFITGSIPAREKRVLVEGTRALTVTGSAPVPRSKARGEVEFRNLTREAVAVPAGTVVRDAGGIRFVTTRAGLVPEGVGETARLPVEAVEGGTAGNLDAEAINAIEGRLGLSLSVANPEPTTGGREQPTVQASEADRERVKSLLMRSLEEQALVRFAGELSPGDLLFDRSLAVSQVLSETYDPPPGAAGRRLMLTLQVEYSVLYADASDLAELASLALNASLPAGFAPGRDPVGVEPVSSPTVYRDGSVRWTMRAGRTIVRQVSPAQVVYLVQGLGARQAEARLQESLPLAGLPQVRLSPPWWPWMPVVPFRISVTAR